MRNLYRRSFTVVWTAVVLSACGHAQKSQVPDDVTQPGPEALLKQLRRKSANRTNLRALGRLTALTPDGRVRLRAVFVAERPRSFRVETLTPFEQPVDVMVSDGERLWLLREGRLFEGPATSDNVARVLPLPLLPEEIVETLLGGVPVSKRFRPRAVSKDGDRWVLSLTGPEGERGALRIDPRSLRVLQAELHAPSGELRTSVAFDGFTTASDGGPAVPTDIAVQVPPQKVQVRIRLRETETDVELPEGLFELKAPSGERPEPISEG